MEFRDFFAEENQNHWLLQLKGCQWEAARFLYSLLCQEKLEALCGKSKVLLLTEGERLISFCTLAEKDDIQPTDLTPWIGFVYTFPEFRGQGLAGRLLGYAEKLAAEAGIAYVYVSTNHKTLYERYGYQFVQSMKDVNGEASRVYRKDLTKAARL